MKTKMVFVIFFVMVSLNSHAQIFNSKAEFAKFETERKKIMNLKVKEVRAYLYKCTNGKFDETGEIAENIKYNQDGYQLYKFTKIEPGNYGFTMTTKNTYENNRIASCTLEMPFSGFTSTTTVEYTYSNGNLIKEVDRTKSSLANTVNIVTNEFIYDEIQNMIEKTTTGEGYKMTIKYNYDENGNLITNVCNNKDFSFTNNLTYDSRNNLTLFTINSSNDNNKEYSYLYDAANNQIEFKRIQTKAPKGTSADWIATQYQHCLFTYNTKNQLIERIDKDITGAIICKIMYEYSYFE